MCHVPISALLKALEARVEYQFTYSSNYSVPGTRNPTEYFVGDGLPLTLQCSYTNDDDNMPPYLGDFFIQIERLNLEPGSFEILIASGRMFGPLHPVPKPPEALCHSTWDNVCEINFDESGNLFAGSMDVSHPSYDSGVESGVFYCSLLRGGGYDSARMDITGN